MDNKVVFGMLAHGGEEPSQLIFTRSVDTKL